MELIQLHIMDPFLLKEIKMYVSEISEGFHGGVNGHHQGRVVTSIRLSGCNLACSYCDTAHTQDPKHGRDMNVPDIVAAATNFGHKHICLTGGEPLLHKTEVLDLLSYLWHLGYKISVETNGTIDITPFFRYVESFVIDYKMGMLHECTKRILSAYCNLREKDVIKFVVKDEEEAMQAFFIKEHLESNSTSGKAIFAFSPIEPNLSAKRLAELLLQNKVRNSVISLQIHKVFDLK